MSIPVGYLIPALFVLLCVYYIVTPTSWPRPFRVLPFSHNYLGWWVLAGVVNELPFYPLVWLVANTALAASQGDVASPGGWVVFGLNVLAAIGLLALFVFSLRTASVISQALNVALNRGWTDGLDPRIVRGLGKRFSARALLGPFFVRRAGVNHVRNLSYGTAGKYNTLDVYHRESKPDGGGVFIHLHGGALRSGHKDRDALPVLYHLATHGWVCLSANYRLQPHARFDEQVDDIRQVVSWAKAHAAEYGGDPDFIMIGGDSSGGHLAAMIGLEVGMVDAVVAICGNFYYGPTEEAAITHIHQDAPPFFLLHGDRDNLVPVEGTRRFAEALQRVSSKSVAYAELPYGEHLLDLFNSVRSLAIARAVEAFGAWAQKAKRGLI
jgi:acetyl esterase/lipase